MCHGNGHVMDPTITQNEENEDLCLICMNRVGGFLPQRQEMVIAYAHAHKTAIR